MTFSTFSRDKDSYDFLSNYTSVDPKQLEKSDAYGTLHAAYHILVAVVLVVGVGVGVGPGVGVGVQK